MKTLHVTVVPAGVEIHPVSRSTLAHDYKIDVAVQKKFSVGDAEELDPLMELVEELAAFFRLRRLEEYGQAIWVRTENEPLYAAEHMEQFRQFTSVLTFTFRVTG